MTEEKRFIDKILLENANLKARVNELVVEIDELQEDKLDLTNMNEEWEDKYVELVGSLRVKIEYILKNRFVSSKWGRRNNADGTYAGEKEVPERLVLRHFHDSITIAGDLNDILDSIS